MTTVTEAIAQLLRYRLIDYYAVLTMRDAIEVHDRTRVDAGTRILLQPDAHLVVFRLGINYDSSKVTRLSTADPDLVDKLSNTIEVHGPSKWQTTDSPTKSAATSSKNSTKP